MKRIWTSNIRDKFKIRAFKATVETVLLYGSQFWTIPDQYAEKMDRWILCLLRMDQIIPCKPSNEKLYNGSPKATDKISKECQKNVKSGRKLYMSQRRNGP